MYLRMTSAPSTTLSGDHRVGGPAAAAALLQAPRRPLSLTFVRRLDVPFDAALGRFDEWWRVASWQEAIDVAGSRLVGPPHPGEDGDERTLGVLLGRGTVQSPVPMDLHISQWSASYGTTLELTPRRRIHAGHAYFRSGHLLLDRVAAAITG